MNKSLILLMLSFLFLGCAERITDGIIYEKVYTPRRTSTIYIPMTIGDSTFYMPSTQVYEERWYVKFYKINEEKQKKNFGYAFVTEDIYNKYNIGDPYPSILEHP